MTMAELGTQNKCRDNVSLILGLHFLMISIFVVATPFRHQRLNFFYTYFCFSQKL